MRGKRFGKWTYGIAVVLLSVVGGILFLPVLERCWHDNVMLARTRSWYELAIGDSDTLYFTGLSADSLLPGLSVSVDVARREFLSNAFFVSYSGRLATAADTLSLPDSLLREDWLPALDNELERLGERIRNYRLLLDETAYYERTHSVVDEGFNQVMEHQELLRTKLEEMERTYDCAVRMKERTGGVAYLRRTHEICCRTGKKKERKVYPCYRQAEDEKGVAVWQTATDCLPFSSNRFRPNPFPYTLFHFPNHLYRVWGCFGDLSSLWSADTSRVDMFCIRMAGGEPVVPVPETADGMPVAGEWGCLNGMMVRGRFVSSWNLYCLQWKNTAWYTCVWEDVEAWLRRVHRKIKEELE